MATIRAHTEQETSGHELLFATRDHRRAVELARYFDRSAVALDRAALAHVDAAFVTSAIALHKADLELTLEAGVPIFIEKPLAASATEGAWLATIAESAGVTVICEVPLAFR